MQNTDMKDLIALVMSNKNIIVTPGFTESLKHARKLPNGDYAAVYVDQEFSGEWFVGRYLTEHKDWARAPDYSGFSEQDAINVMHELQS